MYHWLSFQFAWPRPNFKGCDHFYWQNESQGTIFPLKISVRGTQTFRTKIPVKTPVHCTRDNAASAELKCHIHLLDTYISKFHPSVGNEQGAFYLYPQQKNTTPTMPWFSSVPTGNNTLSAKLKNMYHDAGINGNKVNHGLHQMSKGAVTLPLSKQYFTVNLDHKQKNLWFIVDTIRWVPLCGILISMLAFHFIGLFWGIRVGRDTIWR